MSRVRARARACERASEPSRAEPSVLWTLWCRVVARESRPSPLAGIYCYIRRPRTRQILRARREEGRQREKKKGERKKPHARAERPSRCVLVRDSSCYVALRCVASRRDGPTTTSRASQVLW